MEQLITLQVTIQALPAQVWHVLTNRSAMERWLGEPEMDILVHTNWQVGTPIVIRGFHHEAFENKGVILQFTPEKCLRYSHLSSVSHLSDYADNYTIFEFVLLPLALQTQLTLHIKNFPTEVIRKHLAFYWPATLSLIKQQSETLSLSS
ncbi:MAG: SRPBCC domain-containing protein [Spirosomataceae bacterium]